MSGSAFEAVGESREPLNEEVTMKATSEEEVPVHEEFMYIYGAATEVLKCGPGKDPWKNENAARLLFLVIPGNPGLVGYYRTYIQALFRDLNKKYPVWVVSHAGHLKAPRGMGMMEETEEQPDDAFGLPGQVDHKLNFLRQNVPKDVKLVLIGHSIGCYIALDIMKRAPELEVLRCVMLFPTIERMAQTPQGRIMTPLFCQFRYIAYMPIYLLTLLPERVKQFLIYYILRGLSCYDESMVITSFAFGNMALVANVFYMAGDEMRKVVERDSTTIREHLTKLIFYYGAKDSWCPVQYYKEMKMEFPDGDIRLCDKGFRHAFVLDTSKEVAAMVADWLQDDLAKL